MLVGVHICLEIRSPVCYTLYWYWADPDNTYW
jgi:hypothetical protein